MVARKVGTKNLKFHRTRVCFNKILINSYTMAMFVLHLNFLKVCSDSKI